MSVLNFDNKPGRNMRKPFKLVLGIGTLAAVVAVTTTLASNININAGPVEFGQGVAQTTACDDSIMVTPVSAFVNGPMPSASPSPSSTPTSTPSPTPTAAFYLDTIALSEIDSSESGCAGKYFTIKAYDNSNSDPLEFYPGTDFLTIYDEGNAFTSNQGGMHVGYEDGSAVSIYIHSPTLSASEVYKITIESSDRPDIVQFISVGSCDFDSIGGDTSTAITSIADGLIDGIPGASIVGDAQAWGMPAPTFNSFVRDDGVSLGEGFALSSGWGDEENATLDTCLEDLLSESYPDVDPLYNVHAITFTVSVPSNINGFNFDWIFASNEDAVDEYDTAALIVDGRDYALLSDGKVVHVYNNNLNSSTDDFETAPYDLAEDLNTPSTWSNKFYSRATFDKANNPPDGSGFSVHQITIAAGNTGDTSANSSIFVSNFRG